MRIRPSRSTGVESAATARPHRAIARDVGRARRHAAWLAGATALCAVFATARVDADDSRAPGAPAVSVQAAEREVPRPPTASAMQQPSESVSPPKLAAAAGSAAEWHARRGLYYRRNFGVDVVGVHPVSSGYMLTFRYRVVDVEKAKGFAEKKTKPYLIDEASGTVLAVPAMENVGELRQTTTLEEGREYFVVFGNPGKLVKPGSVVTVVVGKVRIEGLVAQ